MTIQDFSSQLLAHMGMKEIQVDLIEDEDTFVLSFKVDEEESGLLIGRHAETLEGIQLIIRLLFQKDYAKPISVNINDFREKRKDYLFDLAERTAERVVSTGRPQTLRLSASERRLIHLALSENETVETASEGEGKYRVLRVFLKESQPISV